MCELSKEEAYGNSHSEKQGELPAKHRFYHNKYAYGINSVAFEQMYRQQLGLCDICRSPFPPLEQRNRGIVVDHDHSTGAVRALLCNKCNVAVAMVSDDPQMAQRLVAYLEKHKLRSERNLDRIDE